MRKPRVRIALLLACLASPFAVANDNLRHDVVIDGVRLAYWTSRPLQAGDVPAVFLHGGPGYNSYSFRKTAGAALESRFPMVYLDERGSGASERPWTKDYSMAAMVRDIEGLRRDLGVDRIVAMGHSFGGALAAEYAIAHPDRVARLVLLDAAIDMPAAMASWADTLKQMHPSEYVSTLAGPAGKAMLAVDPQDTCTASRKRMAFVDAALETLDSQGFHDVQQFHDRRALEEQQRLDAASGYRNTGEIGAAMFAADASFLCYRVSRPAQLTMPTLVIVGKHDRAVGVEPQRKLAAQLPDAHLVVFDDSAHFPYAEEPATLSARHGRLPFRNHATARHGVNLSGPIPRRLRLL